MSTERRLARLWERMTALYGSRWELEYGPVASPTGDLAPLAAIWAEALADFDGETLAKGLRHCLDRSADRPPTLPEFLHLCGRRPHSAAACHQALPRSAPRPAAMESPVARCTGLAELLAEAAKRELAPELRTILPDARRAAIRDYWLKQMQELGAIGQALAHQLARPAPAPETAP